MVCPSVVSQDYRTEADNEFVIKGNSALLKCEIPSFVADFVSVQSWIDSEDRVYYPSNKYGKLLHIIHGLYLLLWIGFYFKWFFYFSGLFVGLQSLVS